jgi:hypothetical protein
MSIRIFSASAMYCGSRMVASKAVRSVETSSAGVPVAMK